jgi:uncharacterized membrane protein
LARLSQSSTTSTSATNDETMEQAKEIAALRAALAKAWFERDEARYGLVEMHRERNEARDENERLRSEYQAAVEVAVAADEYWDVAECDCCGGIPFCSYRTEHREANQVGERLTDAITRFKATIKEKP